MNKGFTLIELLAVIVVLGVLLTFSTVSVVSIINDAKANVGEYTKEQITDAAKLYATDNLTASTENAVTKALSGKDQIVNALSTYYPQISTKCTMDGDSKVTITIEEVSSTDFTGGNVSVEIQNITCES